MRRVPDRWRWGGPATSPVHLALLLYAADEPRLESLSGSLSFAELHHAFPDATTRRPEAAALLDCLFPKRLSNVWSLA